MACVECCKYLTNYRINCNGSAGFREASTLPHKFCLLFPGTYHHAPAWTDRHTPLWLDVSQSFLLNSLPVPVVFTKMSRVLSRSVLPLTRLSLAIAGPPIERQASERGSVLQGSSATTRPAVLGSSVFQPSTRLFSTRAPIAPSRMIPLAPNGAHNGWARNSLLLRNRTSLTPGSKNAP